MLHIVNKSPFSSPSLESCLRVVQPGSAVLLIEDGIYAATAANPLQDRTRKSGVAIQVYALAPDVDARGMRERIVAGVELVDYAGFVDLVTTHDNVQSWL